MHSSYPSPKPNFLNHLPFAFYLNKRLLRQQCGMHFHVLYLCHNLSLLVVLRTVHYLYPGLVGRDMGWVIKFLTSSWVG